MIKGFQGEYRFLSNFFGCLVEYGGRRFLNSEAAYQSAKCENDQDIAQFETMTALDAKKQGAQVGIKENWDDIKDQVMYNIVLAKFNQNKGLRERLLQTGDVYLEETNTWGDRYWGVCDGEGLNKLGHVLMRVREELK